jgi:hypothetical protein
MKYINSTFGVQSAFSGVFAANATRIVPANYFIYIILVLYRSKET